MNKVSLTPACVCAGGTPTHTVLWHKSGEFVTSSVFVGEVDRSVAVGHPYWESVHTAGNSDIRTGNPRSEAGNVEDFGPCVTSPVSPPGASVQTIEADWDGSMCGEVTQIKHKQDTLKRYPGRTMTHVRHEIRTAENQVPFCTYF